MGKSWKWFSKYIKRLEENQSNWLGLGGFFVGEKKVGQNRRQS